jgi:hypothetical protein
MNDDIEVGEGSKVITKIISKAEKDATKVSAKGGLEPNPNYGKEETVTIDTKESTRFRKDTVLYLIYLLYKCNIFTRGNLKEVIAEIDNDPPEALAQWLVKEAVK